MDFVERIFGVSPDGGSGVFELMLFVVPIAILSFTAHRRRHWSIAKWFGRR